MPQVVYKLLLKFVQSFFTRFGHSFPFHLIGTWLYALAGYTACRYLIYKVPEIKSIYRITNYYDGWFQPGISDLDLIPILTEVKTEEELGLVNKINKARAKLNKFFPFIWIGGSPFFESDFKYWYKINTDYIHHGQRYVEMELVYGQEIRPLHVPVQKQKISGGSLRFFYEEMLGNIYHNVLFNKSYYRIFYKFFQIYAQAGYVAEESKEAPNLDSEVLQNWLIKAGCELIFIKQVIDLKENNFISQSPSFNTDATYNLIKVTNYLTDIYNKQETRAETDYPIDIIKLKENKKTPIPTQTLSFVKALSKESIISIVLTKNIYSPKLEAFSLYLVCPDKGTDSQLKKQVQNVLDNLHLLKDLLENIKLQHRSALLFTKSVFPVIFTEKTLEFDTFVNGDCFYEALNISSNGYLLFGNPPKIKYNTQTFTKAWHFIAHLALAPINKTGFEAIAIALLRNELLTRDKLFDFSKDLSELYQSVFQEKKPEDFKLFYLKIRSLIKDKYYPSYINNHD